MHEEAPSGRLPDMPVSSGVHFGDIGGDEFDYTPHTVAMMASVALLGIIGLRLSGFRFVVGGAAGVLR